VAQRETSGKEGQSSPVMMSTKRFDDDYWGCHDDGCPEQDELSGDDTEQRGTGTWGSRVMWEKPFSASRPAASVRGAGTGEDRLDFAAGVRRPFGHRS
jgi:hypothetical protein